jgi:hypothetical protein
MLVLDAYTPNFDTHDFRDDVTNEASGTGYTSGGVAHTATEITLAANAMAAVQYFNVGAAGTDQLILLSDFVTAASTTNGTFQIAWHASGIFTLDFTP